MRIPTFSRQTETDTTENPTPAATTDTSPVRARRDPDATADLPAAPASATKPERKLAPPPPPPSVGRPTGSAVVDKTPPRRVERDEQPRRVDRDEPPTLEQKTVAQPVVEAEKAPAGPKPRASLLATLGLILGVASVLLVLSGPLLGYGIGVAAVALILSLSGIHATGKRHVAGKTDALLGMILSLAAIVLGVLALTGSLNWLGTDVQPVNNLREWLDAQFVDRF
ncbi:thrombospondin [Actinoplanes sp. NPDC049596]|uniref:thrombospondin n=1 Tax=unclassified Actinoplanes TaxID=2626549 RepID=UPI00343256EB